MQAFSTAVAATSVTWSAAHAAKGVPAWDADLFRRINRLPDMIAPIAWLPMQAGALGAPLAVGAVLLKRGKRRAAVRTVVTGAAAWGAAKVLKRQVGRDRPSSHIDETVLRIGAADRGLGYPSGHAAVAVAWAASAGIGISPAWRAAGIALAATVGASRIYVGAHYPLDVLGGWALGALVGGLYAAIASRNGS